MVLEAGSLRSGCGQVLGEGSLPGYVFTWPFADTCMERGGREGERQGERESVRERERYQSPVSSCFYKGTNPIRGVPPS